MKLKKIVMMVVFVQSVNFLCAMENEADKISSDAWILAWQEIKDDNDPGYVDKARAEKFQKALDIIRSECEELSAITIPLVLKLILTFSKKDLKQQLPESIKTTLIDKYGGQKVYECTALEEGTTVQHYSFKPSVNLFNLLMHINKKYDGLGELPIKWGQYKTFIYLQEKAEATWKFDFIQNFGKEIELISRKNESVKSNQVMCITSQSKYTINYNHSDEKVLSTKLTEKKYKKIK